LSLAPSAINRRISQLEGFFQNHPKSHTEIAIAPSNDVQRMLIDGEAHVGVVLVPHTTPRHRAAATRYLQSQKDKLVV
jgi:DNA-binding transcriptional LysR family regulator